MVQLTESQFHVIVLSLSWIGGFLPVFLGRRMSWLQGVGLAFLLYPFVRMAVRLLRTYELLFTPTVLQPASEIALWYSVENQIWYNFVLPFVGLFLLHNPWTARADSPLRRERFPAALADHGVTPKRSLRHDVKWGLSLFPLIALAYIAAYVVSKFVAPIVAPGSDESLYWRNITLPLIILLSFSAGIAEEFLFRGVLLSGLRRFMPWGVAALAQAVFFGLIHAGYGTWTHVLGPAAFGLGMAWVARHLGIITTALLHASVNVVFFTVDVAPTYVAVNGFPGAFYLGSVSIVLLTFSIGALHDTRGEAVRILWHDLLRMLGVRRGTAQASVDEAPPAADEPRAS